jgi:formylglycine-generating enzyme required for sulfatase activity
VEQVSWLDTQEFLRKLNEKERGRGYVYRLPTSVEWEYACRGGAVSEEECSFPFYFVKPTNTLTRDLANYGNMKRETGRPTRVGAFPPNKLGLRDMHGNVWQWCQDQIDPKLPHRRLRGGSYETPDSLCQAAYESQNFQGRNGREIGFRLVRVRQPSDK